jgi:hypothetical protein
MATPPRSDKPADAGAAIPTAVGVAMQRELLKLRGQGQ